MLHVGLTGNIASGKSQATLFFAELGAHIIDADLIAHELLEPDTETYKRVAEAFGEQILQTNRTINRKKLGEIVFSSAEKRLLLNSLVHPMVRNEILRRIFELEQASSSGIVIVDAALMIETGNHNLYDRLIVVTCDPALQIARLMSRNNLTMEEARARMDSQMPVEEKLKLADYIIITSGTLKETHEQVKAVYRDLLLYELRMEASTEQ